MRSVTERGFPVQLGLPFLATLVLAACSAPDASEAPAGTSTATVFEGARLLDGNGGAPIDDAVFVVDNGRFTAVGRRGEVQVPAGATVVDLAGKTVMPAIVNAHMHLSSEREPLVSELQHNAYYGAGVVVSLGLDTSDIPVQMENERVADGARILTAGRGITMPEPGRTEAPHWVTTPEEARAAVQAEVARGVDIVKIWVDDRNGEYQKLTPELYGAVIDEAHANGLLVTAHIFALEDAKGLLRAGIDAFAHGVRDMEVDEEFVQMVRDRPNVVLVPNMGARGVAEDLGWLSGTIPAAQLAEMQANAVDRPNAQQSYAIQAHNLATLHEAGMRIAFGTDGGNAWAAHQEIEDMVVAGMSPGDAIVSATKNAAELMGLDDVGTVAAGKSADFVVLDANPLDDITNTRRINAVYLRGQAVDRAAISRRLLGVAAQ